MTNTNTTQTKTTALNCSQSSGLGRLAARVQTNAVAAGKRRELDKNEAWLKDAAKGAEYCAWVDGWLDELAEMEA